MPTPVAHSLIGIIFGALKFLGYSKTWKEFFSELWERRWLLFLCIVLANAPDIDYLFGLFYGNWNKFHQTATHSFLFVFVLSLLICAVLIFRKKAVFIEFWFVFLLVSSHLVLDFFCKDTSFPIGLPLLFPFSYEYFHSKIELFPSVQKKTFADIWNTHNIKVVFVEILFIMPMLFAVLFFKRYGRKSNNEQTNRGS